MLRFSCSDCCGNGGVPRPIGVIYGGVCLLGAGGWVSPVAAVLKHFQSSSSYCEIPRPTRLPTCQNQAVHLSNVKAAATI